MDKRGIYKLNADCGRMGYLEGVFIATDTQVETLVNEKVNVYFGEVLGKHSEIYGAIDEDDISFVTDDQKVLDLFMDHDLESGYNPFYYNVIDFNFEKYEMKYDDDMMVIDAVNGIINFKEKNK